MSSHPLEIPIFGSESGVKAVGAGATRLELNRAGSYGEGGLTPTLEELQSLVSQLPPPASDGNETRRRPAVRIMIRPRGPPPKTEEVDFIYSDEEFEEMKSSLRQFKESGFLLAEENGDGFVFGILKKESNSSWTDRKGEGRCSVVIDEERTGELVKLAAPFTCVFHRAFDLVVDQGGKEDVVKACRFLKDNGMEVLTSGGLGNAVDNLGTLKMIVKEFEGVLVVGGGLRKDNLGRIVEGLGGVDVVKSKTVYFHSSCLRAVEGKEEEFDEGEAMGICEIREGLGEGWTENEGRRLRR
ncbi:copper homeostasis CutC domain-containing protein [Podospora australis]|uniref:Copper homeostasis protein cutC homolog n=1 Tax=Podospora australis TaxID=1536484 RepID=A0AAN6WU40_9PEZI|nr:copper homeostasis CutC domain-containing protein [Podospora australis]